MSDYAIQYAKSLGPDEEAFHRKMIEEPEDRLPALVYADWLEEHDMPHHAAFMRAYDAEHENPPRVGRYLNPGYANPHSDHSVVLLHRNDTQPLRPVTHAEVTLAVHNAAAPSRESWHLWARYLPVDEAEQEARKLIDEGAYPSLGTSHLWRPKNDPSRNDS